MGNWFAKLQSIGKALMLPVAVLPAAALLLRFGAPDVLDIPFMMKAGGAIFDNLALLFAIGIAVGLAKDNNGASGLAGVVGYLVLTNGLKAINPDLNMSVLAGIISGVGAGLIYNRFYNIKLPEFLGFFGGRRFVPIATAALFIVMAGIFGVIWAPIQGVIHGLGEWIIGAGAFGTFVFGFLNRLLIPFGLHHILNSFIWFVFGNYTDAAGKVVTGDLNRFFAGDPHAGMFMAGFYFIFMFGMPAVALAIYHAAKPENRGKVGGVLLSVAFTAFLTGITEPLEFMFMFLAPGLYAVHAVLTGLAMATAYSMGILHGFGFSAGLVDYLLNWGLATKPVLIIPVGLCFGVLYYVIFRWAIKHYDIPTPGRYESEENNEAIESSNISDFSEKVIERLGGGENLETISSCITRLRLTVKDVEAVDEAGLKALGAAGVIKKGKSVQVIVGTRAELIADEMKAAVKSGKPSGGGKKSIAIYAPLKGRVVDITEVPDPTFSQKMMGDGIAIEPESNVLVAPCDGEIALVAETKHAVAISSNGMELLMHIGLDTVELEGKPFDVHVKAGDKVKQGDKLVTFDRDMITAAGKKLITPVLLINMDQVENADKHMNDASGKILTVKMK